MRTLQEIIESDIADLLQSPPSKRDACNLLRDYDISVELAVICTGVVLDRFSEAKDWISGESYRLRISVFNTHSSMKQMMVDKLFDRNKSLEQATDKFLLEQGTDAIHIPAISQFICTCYGIARVGYVEGMLDQLFDCIIEEPENFRMTQVLHDIYQILMKMCPESEKPVKPNLLTDDSEALWKEFFESEDPAPARWHLQKLRDLVAATNANVYRTVLNQLLHEEAP